MGYYETENIENNPENLETNVETTQKEFNFSDDEEFNENFKYHLKYLLKTFFIEDLREFVSNNLKTIKQIVSENLHVYTITHSNKPNLNFEEENKKFMEQIIKNYKNKKVNFYYYEHFLNFLYARLAHYGKHYVIRKIESYIEQNKDYKEIIELIIKHKDYIFEEISEFVKEKIHETGNEKFYNIPEKYASFEEYIKENPKKTFKRNYINTLEQYYENNMFERIANSISLENVNDVIKKILAKIFKD